MSLQYVFQKQDTETIFNNHTICDKENKSFQNFTDIKGEGIKPGQKGLPDLALRGLSKEEQAEFWALINHPRSQIQLGRLRLL